MGAAVTEHETELGGSPVAWRSAPGDDPPVLWLHGVPNASELWTPFLARAGGIALDLPGFGRSGKGAGLDYSISGYAAFLERFLDHLGLGRVALGMHDWGGVGLALAQRHPERVSRLVAIDVVPFLAGYRWHRIARLWRTPGLGELAMGFTSRATLRLALRGGDAPTPPPAFADEVLRHFDHGTQRAILRLYRSAGPDVLAAAGAGLGAVLAPALIVWGERDPYLPPTLADRLATALGGPAEVARVPGAGHWPWLDDPGVVDRVCAFLAAGEERPAGDRRP